MGFLKMEYEGDYRMNINFYMPTKVIIGKECVKNNAVLMKEFGKKALIITGAGSAKKNGSLDDVIDVLNSNNIEFVIYDKVMSNPTVKCAYDGAEFAKNHRVDFIIAIGGGSPMDAAKAINLLACQELTEDELFEGKFHQDIMPMVFIPTTAGTGSEVTPYSILTYDKIESKKSISSPLLFPKLALLDAKYMINLPMTTTINTTIDALSHAVEGMLSIRATTLTDALAIESIEKITECFEALSEKKLDFEQREKLLYASMVAGMVISHTGTVAVHSMGYGLTYFKDIDHGRANGLLLVNFLKLVNKHNKVIISRLLKAMNFETLEDFDNFLNTLLGEKETISKEEFEKYAAIAIQTNNIKNCKVATTYEDLLDIYLRSFE
jgi:alcohol dehydrogenase class IV